MDTYKTLRANVTQTYKIVRFYAQRGRESEVIETGLTLEEAEAHCSREDTHGPGWFDGREKENKTEEEVCAQLERDKDLFHSARKLDEFLR